MANPTEPRKRHSLNIGFDYWLETDAGKVAADSHTLGGNPQKLLRNRLKRAFMAGAEIRNTLCGNCGRRYVGPCEADQHGTGKCEA